MIQVEKKVVDYVSKEVGSKNKPQNTKPNNFVEFVSNVNEVIKETKTNSEACDGKCQTDFVNSMNVYYNPSKSDSIDYFKKGAPSYELTLEDKAEMAKIGSYTMMLGHPAAIFIGGLLIAPSATDRLQLGIDNFKNGNIEEGLQNVSTIGYTVMLGKLSYLNYSMGNQSLEKEKYIKENGVYNLSNRTSLVGVSGNNVGRINYVNGVPKNYYGVVDGKFVMGNVSSGGTGSLTNSLNSGQLGLLGVNNSSETTLGSGLKLNLQLFSNKNSYYSTYDERLAQTPVNNGQWTGERGESMFISNKPETQKILKDINEKGILYNDAVPNFKPVSKHIVEIEGMTTNRYNNFKLADIELAKQLNMNVKEVTKMRKEWKLTWHEDNDTKTMLLVPTDINKDFGHLGGVSEIKKMLEGRNKK